MDGLEELSAHTIALAGDWDLSRGNELRVHIEAAVEAPRAVFDLSRVRYIDSNCIGMLARVHARRAAKGYPRLRLVVPSAQIAYTLAVVADGTPWSIFQTLDEALADWQCRGNNSAAALT